MVPMILNIKTTFTLPTNFGRGKYLASNHKKPTIFIYIYMYIYRTRCLINLPCLSPSYPHPSYKFINRLMALKMNIISQRLTTINEILDRQNAHDVTTTKIRFQFLVLTTRELPNQQYSSRAKSKRKLKHKKRPHFRH